MFGVISYFVSCTYLEKMLQFKLKPKNMLLTIQNAINTEREKHVESLNWGDRKDQAFIFSKGQQIHPLPSS